MKKLKNSLLLLLIGIMFLVFAVGSGESTKSDGKLELVEVSNAYYDGYIAYYIEGTIKNNTDKKYSYAQVTFNLYDSDGSQIGTAIANINDLEPNGTWKFKAIGSGDGSKVASYKLSEITGW